MSNRLKILERQMARSNPAPAPAPASDDLAGAIERLVQERVEAALEQRPVRPPAHVQRLLDQQFNAPAPITDYRQLPPVPKTAPAKNLSGHIFRDGAGVTRWLQVGDKKFEVLRDGAGVALGFRQVDESPVLPSLDIAAKAEARKYDPGEPR